jgi:hypothetical protein
MASIDQLKQQLPIADIAAKLGVDEATASQAVNQALPALLGGLQANAEDPAGAASIAQAVQEHDPTLLDGGVNLNDVDENDGDKIVGHVFGAKKQDVVAALGKTQGPGGSDLIQKLLPMLAPIVLSYLAKQFGGRSGSGGGRQSDGGLGGPLGDLLGGGGGGGAIGDLLGGLLGGAGAGKGKGGDIGDLLGGLLGGGRR